MWIGFALLALMGAMAYDIVRDPKFKDKIKKVEE
jgi:hypothetical protein